LWQHRLCEVLCAALRVEVLAVETASRFRDVKHKRWLVLARQKQVLRNVGEEGMRQDFGGIALGAQALVLVLVQQLQHNVHELVTVLDLVLTLVWEHYLGLSDLQKKQLALSVVEGCHTDEHFINKNSKRPPVDREVVALVHHHLWSQVLWRAAEGLGKLALCQRLGKTVVNNLEVTLLVHEDVFQFEVAVHDALGVQVANGHADLHRVELDYLLWQSLAGLEDLVELTTTDERHDEVESSGRLEEILHPAQEGVIAAE